MRALMILQSGFPPDIRLEKEISALNEGNVKVILISRYKNTDSISYNAKVKIIPIISKPSRIGKLLSVPLFFSPVWLFKILITIHREKIDILHVHDLPLAPLVIVIGKLLQIPVIYDMHENYPAMLEMTTKHISLLKYYITRNYKFAKVLEKYCMSNASALIYVAEEYEKLIPAEIFNKTITALVSNTEIIADPMPMYPNKTVGDPVRLCFVGGYGPSRPLRPLVEAMVEILATCDYELTVVGKGQNEYELKALIEQSGYKSAFQFIPWVPLCDIWRFIDRAHICVLPQLKNDHTDHVLPHKLFQYLKRGKPVIVGNCIPLMRNIEDGDCGFITDFSNKELIKKTLLNVYKSDLEQLGKNGYEYVKTKYPWENDKKRLLDLYNKLSVT